MDLCSNCWSEIDDENIEASYLGLSVEALRAIRRPQKRWRAHAKRIPGNKYVKHKIDPRI
tara:strand:+ start:3048 stop:3227 length:180 start_codon:yes stop_codon:yes gene_type:complete